MKAWAGALWLVAAAGGCSGDGVGGSTLTRASAQVLGTIARERPSDDEAQARLALQQDAWRREHRFLDAVDPGHLATSTRVRQVEIDAGLWSVDELYQLGGQLFILQFSRELGLGAGDGPPLRRFHQGRRGGPDSMGCTSCHWRGGLAGAGDAADNAMLRGDGVHQSSTVARNPPALVGAGLRERLAVEMTAELRALREESLVFAAEQGYAVRVPAEAKGVRFGWLTADPNGELDVRELEGIDADLVVRPFGWKGTVASLRDAAEDALLVHHGMQSEHLVIEGDEDRVGPPDGDDPDGDGVTEELNEGQITALTLFLALQELPQEQPPDDPWLLSLWAQGRLDFETFGCADCHVPELPLDSARVVLPHRYGGPTLVVDASREGAEPRLAPAAEDGALRVRLYSDLRRHRMGSALAEDRPEAGVPADEFLTPPLWGVARSRPYLHDGRAPTLEDAILLHGGEAQAAADAFAELDDAGRAPLRVFLTSLVRARRLVTP
jgi:Di-haem oxidoreductase, putative peroxidase